MTIPDSPNLTPHEKSVLLLIARAWEEFVALPDHHPDDIDEARRAVHAFQNIVGCRVASRVDPDAWWAGTK